MGKSHFYHLRVVWGGIFFFFFVLFFVSLEKAAHLGDISY